MEIKSVTKTDGKRLFIELSKKMRENAGLPDLKKGDRILLMPVRKLSEKQMEGLVGKFVKFFDVSDKDSYALCLEGVVRKNQRSFWEEDEGDLIKAKYALIDSEGVPIDAFDDLNDVFDLQIIPNREKFVNKVNCWKCRKQFSEGYKHCPHCGKPNRQYRKEV